LIDMHLDARVLHFFLTAKGQFISGSSIGEALGLSRVSVHNHLEALRKSGFEFSAIRNRGYRLEREPEQFHPQLFEALLEEMPCPFFKSHIALGEADSTNNVAEIELSKGRETPFLVLADTQTSGRGRRGRTWHSPRHKNLYLSVALRPSLPPARLQTITLWLGLRLCAFLRDRLALPVLIKWPNDLMLHDRKIAGMLTEARVDSEQTRDLVFGLGLNVNSASEDFPPEIRDIASSLSLNLGKPQNLTRMAHATCLVVAEAMRDYLDGQFADELSSAWPEFDYLRGRMVQAGELAGQAMGITSNGSLRLQRPDGSSVILHSGEVSLGSGSSD
jgi:BirA family biotin operon repressor/biotin-[acetyl-CoA-carboxylase] ligase